MLQSVLLILRAALVGGKSRIHCSILQVARWNPPERRQPCMAGQRRTGNGGQAPTLLPDCGGCFRGGIPPGHLQNENPVSHSLVVGGEGKEERENRAVLV